MITELILNGIATFVEHTTMEPLQINFCYGSNGSGKTTISEAIASGAQTGIHLSWATAHPLHTLVYNKAFVDANFGETSKIGGIFTLGQDSKDAQEFITEHRAKLEDCKRRIENLTTSKQGLEKQQQTRELEIDEDCWKNKLEHEPIFHKALTGHLKTKRTFRTKCLQEYAALGNTEKPNIEELKKMYAVAFNKVYSTYQLYRLIDIAQLQTQEDCGLLKQKITGSTDTPIGKFIEFLNSSDWVKQGVLYLEKTDGKCPFCQQDIPNTIRNNIETFFDEAYKRDCATLENFFAQYMNYTDTVLSQLRGILANPISILDYALFKSEVETLSALIDSNIKIIKDKVSFPSKELSIASLAATIERINAIISEFNRAIDNNNDIVANQSLKQDECKKLVWELIVHDLISKLRTYDNDTQSNYKGIKHLSEQIKEQEGKIREFTQLIAEKSASLTSVKPTAEAINGILRRFGFEGFNIEENPRETGTYRIIRPDGRAVGKTLSEGEYNFITFLYFYYLVYGSQDNTRLINDKVVVIDDPISSLDSNVLFIVSTLVKQIVNDCMNDKNGIKQLFILTHNVYFHKEITLSRSRETWSPKQVAFWVVKKKNNVSHITSYDNKNPIQTSYELLWSELKDAKNSQKITIFNTLRRILEYYFNVIGGMKYEDCINKFEGSDKLICKALISCINEGSHFISDDFVFQYENETIDSYLRVFLLIFKRMGPE